MPRSTEAIKPRRKPGYGTESLAVSEQRPGREVEGTLSAKGCRYVPSVWLEIIYHACFGKLVSDNENHAEHPARLGHGDVFITLRWSAWGCSNLVGNRGQFDQANLDGNVRDSRLVVVMALTKRA